MRIAVIGSGISGLSAALRLQAQHEVTLYESDARPGGHAHTVDVSLEQAEFAKNTVRYQASLNFINSQLRGLMTAITGQ